MSVREIGEVIHEYGGSNITLGGGDASMSGNESRGWTHKLINAYNLPWFGCRSDSPSVVNSFAPDGFAMRFTIGAAGASWGFDVCEVFREQSRFIHKLDSTKAEVSQFLVNCHEVVLFALKDYEVRISRSKFDGFVDRKRLLRGLSW